MPYLIDANNLAGSLKLLEEDDFDQKLIDIIKSYINIYSKKITLVFEGTDSVGDKAVDGDLVIIRAPRDSYYTNADVKIIELINNAKEPKKLVVISDDHEIVEAGKKADCEIKRASYFAKILKDLNLCQF